jgi:hypothetical protein
MIASARIVGRAANSTSHDERSGPKSALQGAGKAATHRPSQASRELGEALDAEPRAERGRDTGKAPEIEVPSHDDGPEM